MRSDDKTRVANWWIYMLKCSDGSYYTGITLDIHARIHAHNKGRGSKYVRSRLPARVVYVEWLKGARGEAQKVEAAIKKLSHAQKKELADAFLVYAVPAVLSREIGDRLATHFGHE